ncbi:hypothetical protein Vadar_021952 [Vaccinium darrowii]|uniref:Uncharacterized protein n=1 Tax=Vaccinium darrowii TaxID=229202 RepID=A0ACB7YYE3_9ERIC|nr:hypothetical protein Vadar_021952 [Vaccinium darrowii]
MLRPFSTGGYVYWDRDGWSYLLILETEVLLEVLVLVDPKTGEWRNLYKFDLNGERENNGDVVVFTTLLPIQAPVMLLTMSRQEKLTLLSSSRHLTIQAPVMLLTMSDKPTLFVYRRRITPASGVPMSTIFASFDLPQINGYSQRLKQLRKKLFTIKQTKALCQPEEKKVKYLNFETFEYEKAINFYICSQSDIFAPAISGLFNANVAGKRIASGKTRILVPENVRLCFLTRLHIPLCFKEESLGLFLFLLTLHVKETKESRLSS